MNDLPSHFEQPKRKDRAAFVAARWAAAPVLVTAAHALAINCVDFVGENVLRRVDF